jgi:hypothetical protein
MQGGSADAPTQPLLTLWSSLYRYGIPPTHIPPSLKPRLRDSKRVAIPRESVALLHLSREGLRLAVLVRPPAQQSLAILRSPISQPNRCLSLYGSG